jgi:RNA polymerase sigma-70 factor (ECF subfamily)
MAVIAMTAVRSPKAVTQEAISVASADRERGRGGNLRLVPASQPADGDLLAHTAKGDQAAFRQLLARYLPRLVATARRLLGGDAEAEDVAQEAALRLWRNAARIEVSEAGVGGWLYRVTTNLALDKIRARRSDGPDALEHMTVPPDQQRKLVERDLGVRVDKELQALPERQRVALVLCHYEGMSMSDAGEVMGISSEAIESLLARGRRTLRSALADEWRALLPSSDDQSDGEV